MLKNYDQLKQKSDKQPKKKKKQLPNLLKDKNYVLKKSCLVKKKMRETKQLSHPQPKKSKKRERERESERERDRKKEARRITHVQVQIFVH